MTNARLFFKKVLDFLEKIARIYEREAARRYVERLFLIKEHDITNCRFVYEPYFANALAYATPFSHTRFPNP